MQLSALPRCFYRLRRLPALSHDAARRLRWMEHYFFRGRNAALTCRHFDIPRSTFFYWLRRFDPKALSCLEDRSRRPKRVRSSPLPPSVVDKVIALREAFPAWSKYKLAVLLEREHGITLSSSTLGRIFKKHNLFLPKVRKKGLRRLARKRERTDDEEFYHLLEEEPESIEELNQKMRAWEKVYNTLRPHASLKYLTPAAYLATLSRGGPKRAP